MSRQRRTPDRVRSAVARASGSGSRRSVGPVAHGGHCVVRLDRRQRVVFSRHAVPGRPWSSRSPRAPTVTGSGAATRSKVMNPRRTGSSAPCPYAGPGALGAATSSTWRCRPSGGSRQRWCASRFDGWRLWTWRSPSRPCPATSTACGWRTRQRYVALPDGRRGMRKHRSHDVVPDRRLPDRGGGPGPSYAVLGSGLLRRRGRLLAGASGRPAGAGRDGARDAATRSQGSRRSTCTPAWGCSRPSSWTGWGPARWTAVEAGRHGVLHAGAQPGRRRTHGERRPSTGCWPDVVRRAGGPRRARPTA